MGFVFKFNVLLASDFPSIKLIKMARKSSMYIKNNSRKRKHIPTYTITFFIRTKLEIVQSFFFVAFFIWLLIFFPALNQFNWILQLEIKLSVFEYNVKTCHNIAQSSWNNLVWNSSQFFSVLYMFSRHFYGENIKLW